jgi:hypothetical protein
MNAESRAAAHSTLPAPAVAAVCALVTACAVLADCTAARQHQPVSVGVGVGAGVLRLLGGCGRGRLAGQGLRVLRGQVREHHHRDRRAEHHRHDPQVLRGPRRPAAAQGPGLPERRFTPVFNYHQFWAEVDIATAFESFTQLFPAAQPPSGFKRSRQYPSSKLITAGGTFQLGLGFPESFLPGAGQVIPAGNAASLGCRRAAGSSSSCHPASATGRPGTRPMWTGTTPWSSWSTSSPRCDRPASRARGQASRSAASAQAERGNETFTRAAGGGEKPGFRTRPPGPAP